MEIKIKTDIDNIKPSNAKEEWVFFEAIKGMIKIIHDDFLTTNLIKESSVELIVTSLLTLCSLMLNFRTIGHA